MNQILVKDKLYVTPRVKKKKIIYKSIFILSVIVAITLLVVYSYTEITRLMGELNSKDILDDFSNIESVDSTIADDDTIVVALSNESANVTQTQTTKKTEPKVLSEFNKVYKTSKGTEYKIDSILNIPALNIKYPVIGESTMELLKISLCKFWGSDANAVGNYCIVGHNYDGKDIFFGKLHKLQNGDVIELQDKTGTTLKYKVYNKFIVEPTDVACTSQLTNGKKEVTLITCSEGGKTRLIVKCREV